MKDNFSRGILYIATGQKYIDEAIQSAGSCKEHNHVAIALITDRQDYILPSGLFDQVIIKDAQFSYVDKLLLRHSPFESTIFLDTDTLVCEKLDDLFQILNYREFAIHQADEGYEFNMPEVSNAMPEFNTGVIAYKNTENVMQLFKDWGESFNEYQEIQTDQWHLRKTLYESNVKFAIFSSAYNFIIYYPNFVIQTVKVLHGRPFAELKKIAQQINTIRHENAWRRLYYPYNKTFYIIYQNQNNKDICNQIIQLTRAFIANMFRKFTDLYRRK